MTDRPTEPDFTKEPLEDSLPDSGPAYVDSSEASKIYFLPNLMTAGNLFCGFVAIMRCIQAKFASTAEGLGTGFIETVAKTPEQLYEQAVWFILAAVIFDMLDGRMARMTRKESLFGKEFDSLADVVSFGLAPALLVFFVLLSPTEEFPLVRTLGGLVGFFYLLCAAVRLARYNVLTTPLLPHADANPDHEFLGLPVPAAAGMVSSIVLVLNRFDLPSVALFLPILLILIATLMVSSVRYPSLKTIGTHTKVDIRGFIFLFLVFTAIYLFHFLAIAIVFLGYIFYGLVRHFIPDRQPKKKIG
ncbi:MAG: CDP-diacylglycerol--serine O-phosphatidyltransferase [Puniceicoccaceae bacterium]